MTACGTCSQVIVDNLQSPGNVADLEESEVSGITEEADP
jgi:hypothetical protein